MRSYSYFLSVVDGTKPGDWRWLEWLIILEIAMHMWKGLNIARNGWNLLGVLEMAENYFNG